MSILATLISFALEILTTYFGIKLYTFMSARKALKAVRNVGKK